MIFILDTDIFSLVETPDSPESLRLHARILEYSGDYSVATTIITYEEQTRGWLGYAARSQDISHQVVAYRRLKKHLANYLNIEVLDFDDDAAREYQQLRKQKIRIGTCDLKIAAIALSRGAKLLSRNLVHFAKVPGLDVVDWTLE